MTYVQLCIFVFQITPRIMTEPYFSNCMILSSRTEETLKLFLFNPYKINRIKNKIQI